MARGRVITGFDKLKKFIDSFDKSGRQSELMDRIGFRLANRFKRRMAMGKFKPISSLTKGNRVGGGSGGKPLNDTGRLRQSLTHVVLSKDKVAVGSPVAYAALMQEGGTITPKKAQKLAIPVGRKVAALSQAKGVRGALKELSKSLDIWFTENRIFGTVPGSQKTETLFIRKSKVTIPPRPYLFIDEKDELVVAKTIEAWYKEVL